MQCSCPAHHSTLQAGPIKSSAVYEEVLEQLRLANVSTLKQHPRLGVLTGEQLSESHLQKFWSLGEERIPDDCIL